MPHPQEDSVTHPQPRHDRLLERFFELLWAEYRGRVPFADQYRALVEGKGGRVINDHVAFRSINAPMAVQPAGVAAFLNIFVPLGYAQAGTYVFPDQRLSAVHLEHPHPLLPKLFISQLEVEQLPAEHAALVREAVLRHDRPAHSLATAGEVVRAFVRGEGDVLSAANRILSAFTRPWDPPLRSTVLRLNEVSQYAAWTLLHGNAVNHCTALINTQSVLDWPDLEATVAGLRAAGVPMKDTIEGAPDSKLRQSATHAAKGHFEVTESDASIGTIEWSYAYYELAERGYVTDDAGKSRLFSGFLGNQTTGLFEMTRIAAAAG